MEKMKELYEKVSKDGVLQAKFSTIMNDAKKTGESAPDEKLKAFAKDAGFEIDLDEMKAFFRDLTVKEKGELTDSDLDMVAGGKGGGDVVNSIWSIGIGC